MLLHIIAGFFTYKGALEMQLIKVLLSAIHIVALGLFALKYLRFDVKSTTSGIAPDHKLDQLISSTLASIDAELSEDLPEPPTFDRFVLFLLDAWRWDFLFNEKTDMKFLKEKIMDGESIGLVSLARIPTVTKPCLKSLFSGTLPVFFEIVENIDESGMTETISSSTATTTDNLLHRLFEQGKKISVYGDDVWTKLFPLKMFYRHDVSFGFNIMDYTEVDNSVHLGLKREMEAEEEHSSDVLILHYLGLDHIGHSFAAKDEYVKPKLKEMDAKVEEVYQWIRERDSRDGKKSLLLVMGDHGMTRDGNHGGGSKDEAQAAAVFMSPHFKAAPEAYKSWSDAISAAECDSHNQEDLAATLTALLDASGPLKFGSGCLIKRLMASSQLNGKPERLLLLQNLKHLLERASIHNSVQVVELLSRRTKVRDSEEIYSLSMELKSILISDGFTFDETKLKLLVGVLLCAAVLASIFFWLPGFPCNLESLAILVSLSTLTACQLATSFIAEEHTIWQASFVALILVWALSAKSKNSALFVKVFRVLLLHRILCSWNSIGTMWIHEKSVGGFLKDHSILQMGSLILALFSIVKVAFKQDKMSRKSKFVHVFAACVVFLHRSGVLVNWISSHLLAQAALVIVLTELSFKNSKMAISAAIMFVLVNKPSNSLPIAIILGLSREVQDLEGILGPASTFLYLCLMQCAYFALGLWNSVSAIDLTFGAIFSKKFNMHVAPFVLLLYCWSGPILVALSVKRLRPRWYGDLVAYRLIIDAFAGYIAYFHRFHAWTFDFFSPKILFQVFWAIFYTFIVPLIFKINGAC